MRTCPDGTHCQNEDLLEDLAAERDRWATEVERLLEAIAWHKTVMGPTEQHTPSQADLKLWAALEK